jgi:serpin B
VAGSTTSNAVLSPYSISAALTMLDVGAAGDTATQIQTTLDLPGTGATVAPAFATLECEDEADGALAGKLAIANALFGQTGARFEPSFLSVLANGYGAALQQVDFGNPAAATGTVNGWVSTQTEGKIPALLSPGLITTETRLVLADALYFRGAWATAFDPTRTMPAPFALSNGSEVMVPTMIAAVYAGVSCGGAGAQQTTLELPYDGDAMAMDVFVPYSSLAEWEANLSPATLSAALSTLVQIGTEVTLPRFSFATTTMLGTALMKMGMVDAFGTGANFSGIDGSTDLHVQFVAHEATIEVDEQGTVATAATVIGDGAEATSCFDSVAVDRPFAFLIRDTKTGSILLMGHVEDPRQGS